MRAVTTLMPALPLTSDCLAYDAVGQVDEAHFGLADVVAAAAHESAQVAPGLPDKAGGRGHKRRVKRGGGVELVPLVRVDGSDDDGAVNWLVRVTLLPFNNPVIIARNAPAKDTLSWLTTCCGGQSSNPDFKQRVNVISSTNGLRK